MAAGYSVSTKFLGIDGMSKIFGQIGSAGKAAASGIGSAFKSVDGKISGALNSTVGQFAQIAGLAGGVYTVKSAIEQTITSGLKFEQTMVNAAVKFGSAAKPGSAMFTALSDKAKNIGLTTEYTATQAAEAFRLLGAAGFNAGQTIAASSGLMDMATAAEIDLNTATIASANALAVFNLKTKDSIQLQKNMARVSDVMVAAVNAATLETEDYLETMKTGGPVFASLNRPIEEFAAMTAILAESGIKGSMAGTTLKNAILRLIAPVGEGRDALKALGINAADSMGELKPMQQIIQEIATAQKGRVTTEKAAAINAIFGRHAVSGMLGVMEKGPAAIDEMVKAMENATGGTKDMATMMRDTSEVRIKLMQSAIEGLQLSIFEGLKPVITDVTKAVGDWSSQMSIYFKENPKRVGEILDMTLKIGELILVLWGLVKVMTVIDILSKTNPWVLAIYAVIAVVALLAIYFGDLKTAIDVVNIAAVAMFTAWAIGFAVATGGIGPLIIALVAAFMLLISKSELLQNIFKAVFTTIGSLIANSLLYPLLAVMKIWNVISKAIGLGGIQSQVDSVSGLIDKMNNARDKSISDVFASDTPTNNSVISPDITRTQLEQETKRIELERIRSTENKLIIKDETGRARLEGKSTGFYSLERTMTPQ